MDLKLGIEIIFSQWLAVEIKFSFTVYFQTKSLNSFELPDYVICLK